MLGNCPCWAGLIWVAPCRVNKAVSLLFSVGILAFVAALILTPLVRDAFRRLGLLDHPDQGRKLHPQPIPRVGGVAIVLSYGLAFGVAAWAGLLPAGWAQTRAPAVGGSLLAGVAVVFLLGLLDDLVGLRPWQKLAGQLVAAGLVWRGGIRVEAFRGHDLEAWLSFCFTTLWLIGCTNAFNLIDGMDGLAAGVGLSATITILIAALTSRHLDLAILTFLLAGSLLGFLRYNFNPASVFLGDCGSLSIGFFLGCCGVVWSQKSATLLGITAPIMALSIPLLDAGLAVIRRFLRKQPVFGADRRHIHHRLLEQGLTQRRATLLMYGICALAATFSLLQNAVHDQYGTLIVVVFCAAAWIGIQHLGYSEFGIATRLVAKGALWRIVDEQVRLEQLQQALAGAQTTEQYWEAIRAGCRDFGFAAVRWSVQGRIFGEEYGNGVTGPQWQLRIPLSNSQYINLYRDLRSETHQASVGAVARLLEAGLKNVDPGALLRSAEGVKPQPLERLKPGVATSSVPGRARAAAVGPSSG